MLFSKRRVVRLARAVVREGLEHHPEAPRPRRVREAAQGVGEERITGDLLRRLEHHEGEHPADPSRELASRRMRVITELTGRIQDASACLAGDLDVRSVVEHEGHGRPRNPGEVRDICAGGTFRHHSATARRLQRRRRAGQTGLAIAGRRRSSGLQWAPR